MNKKISLHLIICLFVLCCSVKRNNFKNRAYHKINSDFNTIFNGKETLKEEVAKIQAVYTEDFSTILRLNKMPLIKKNDSVLLKEVSMKGRDVFSAIKSKISFSQTSQESEVQEKPAGFDRIVEKSTKAIGNHSMFIKGKERNPSIYKSYEMIGKTRYFRGQSLPAIEAFEYAKEVTKNKNHKANEEIKRWLAKSYNQLGNEEEAEKIYKDLINNTKHKKKLKHTLFDYTQFYIDNDRYKEADVWLEKSIKKEKNKKNKARLIFISAQLKFLINQKEESLNRFVLARKYKPTEQMELKTYTNYILQKEQIDSIEIKSLEKKLNTYLTKISFSPYKDEIYYALALLHSKQNDKKKTEEYLAKSLKESASDGDNRMVIYKRLGEKFFLKDRYDLAKKYYDSAYSFARQEKREPLKDRLDKLTSINELYNYVVEKDSVLKLSKMPKEEQKIFFENYISNLKKADTEKEEKEAEKKNKLLHEEEQKKTSRGFGSNKDSKNWYFYNSTAKSIGIVEFKKKWGNRTLKDNWRKSLGVFNEAQTIQTNGQKEVGKQQKTLLDKYKIEKYLEKIPDTEEKRIEMTHGRDSMQLKLGIAYYNYFKNIEKSTACLTDLIEKKPLNDEITQKAYFNLYKMYQSENKEEEREKNKKIIIEKYPESMYASFVKNPEGFLSNEISPEALSLYKNALELFRGEKFNESLSLIDLQVAVYRGQSIEPKFALLRAYNTAKTKDKQAFVLELNKIIFLYETSSEAEKSREILKTILTPKENFQNIPPFSTKGEAGKN